MDKKVFIGVGHGGIDPGAVSGKFKESVLNLTIALAAKEELERHGVSVGISRVVEETDKLIDEIKECNAFSPDVAIEVHNNAGSPTADGFEVYIQTDSRKAASTSLAKAITKRVNAMGQNNHGEPLKTKKNADGTDYFGWLRQTKCPAVLLEGFFVDGLKDRLDFDTEKEQQKLGKAYAQGVLDYLGIAVKAQSSPSTAPSAPVGKGQYLVQAGAFDKRTGANEQCGALKAAGIPAFVKMMDGKYIVQAGIFNNRTGAENLKKLLASKGFPSFIKKV